MGPDGLSRLVKSVVWAVSHSGKAGHAVETLYEQRFFYGKSVITAQHRNSSNLGTKTRFSCVCGRTRKLRGSISSQKGLRKLMFSETPAVRSLRSLFAEADPEIQPKNLRGSSRGRRKQTRLQALLAEGLREGFAEGVVSVVKLCRNTNQNSYG